MGECTFFNKDAIPGDAYCSIRDREYDQYLAELEKRTFKTESIKTGRYRILTEAENLNG